MALTRGRIAKTLEIVSVRELVRDDLQALKAPRAQATVARFRDPHHRLARMFAAGLRQHEVIARSGYSNARVTAIAADPAFKELVSKYREKVNEAFVDGVEDFYELATTNMLKAERQIAEKLDEADEAGELLPTKDLLAISRDAADRFGFGKKQTNTNINVDFAAALEKAIARSGKTIDGSTVMPTRLDPPAAPTRSVASESPPARQVPAAPGPPSVMQQAQTFRRRA